MTSLSDAIAAVAAAPLDPRAHETAGDAWQAAGRPIPAAACYRTAESLGPSDPVRTLKLATAELRAGRPEAAERRLAALPDQAPSGLAERLAKARDLAATAPEVPLSDHDHNRHFRMATLATFLRSLDLPETLDLLDVGGGDGLLALHLPQARYRLAEPGTNGLRGEALPFPARSVDAVVACHVLEHVPAAARFAFLDSLRAVSRGHLVLLNPFAVPESRYEERLQLILDLTGAAWAREHLECGLPELELVREYAAARGLTLHVEPNGATPTSFLGTLVGHYAHLAGKAGELARIQRYLNSLAPEALTSERLPNSYLVHFQWD